MKYISITALFLFIVVFPLGSWYYLQKGFDYRKAALDDLQPKASVQAYFSDSLINVLKLQEKSTLMIFPDSEMSVENLDKIFDQFRKAYTFQLVNLSGKYNNSSFAKYKNWVNASMDSTKAVNDAFAIIDRDGNIRNYYNNEDKNMRDMIEHLSIVIPSRPPKDIVEKK
jgi:hypothetical protein